MSTFWHILDRGRQSGCKADLDAVYKLMQFILSCPSYVHLSHRHISFSNRRKSDLSMSSERSGQNACVCLGSLRTISCKNGKRISEHELRAFLPFQAGELSDGESNPGLPRFVAPFPRERALDDKRKS